ncbi:MAG: sugar phosphate isomerase/epimerase family protein, partial [Anaerolineae bacterium]
IHHMIDPGLVSVTFRKLSPREIVDLAQQAGLVGIEWGGDVHVPHGDLNRAREVAAMTQDAGLRVMAYGSYYRVGQRQGVSFKSVLDTARALGAPVIRVWAGDQPSAQADAAHWGRIIAESRRIGDLAAEAGLRVVFEFHGGTLTDTNESARQLIEQVDHPAVGMYWQPVVGHSIDYNLAGLRAMLPWLVNVHVFHWGPTTQDRHPLADGESEWRRYLAVLSASSRLHGALLEFVPGDAPETFLRDAATLKDWLLGF